MRRIRSFVVATALAALSACSVAGPPGPGGAVPPEAVVTWRATGARSHALELRSATDGRVLSVLIGPTDERVSAVRTGPTSLLLSTVTGCSTVLERLDIASGARVRVRELDRPALEPAVSPDGRTLAFVTFPSCRPPSAPSSLPAAGPVAFLPNVLVVTPLAGGPLLTTATDEPGHPLVHPVWSPDGSTVAATYLGDAGDLVLLVDAKAPSFRAARRVPAPRGCRLSVQAWAPDGLYASESCGRAVEFTGRLLRITPSGQVAAGWALPSCVSSVEAAVRTGAAGLALVEHVGSGNGACGRRWSDRLLTLDGAAVPPRLVTALPLRTGSSELDLVG